MDESAPMDSRREAALPAASVVTTSTLAASPELVRASDRFSGLPARDCVGSGAPATPQTGSVELVQAKSPGSVRAAAALTTALATTGTSARTCSP